jgi:hypothetical protein
MKKTFIADRATSRERIQRLPTSKDPIAILLPTQAAKGWSPEISIWTSLPSCSTAPVGSHDNADARLSDHAKQRPIGNGNTPKYIDPPLFLVLPERIANVRIDPALDYFCC